MKGIQIASNSEWESIVSLLGATQLKNSPYGPYFFHRFHFWEEEALVYFSGYSKVRAAGTAQYMISRFGLETVIVAGSCGGVDSRLAHLDVVIATQTGIYDCIDRLELQTVLFHDDFKTTLNLNWLNQDHLPPKTHLGLVATADQDIDHTVRELLKPEGVLVADWESGAVAMVCALNRVRTIVFRGVSDLPAEGLSQEAQAEQYRKNIPLLMKRIIEEYLPLVTE